MTDKVFLLTHKDIYEYIIKNKEILGNYNLAYPRLQTVYSTQNIPYESNWFGRYRLLDPGRTYSYWINTPSDYFIDYGIKADGLIGVRPALYLKTAEVASGKGTESDTYRIKVIDDEVRKIILNPTSTTAREGTQILINAYVEPFYADVQSIKFESTNLDVIYINKQNFEWVECYAANANIIVKALRSGKATIRATSNDDKVTAEATIIVVPEATENGIKIGDYIEFSKYNGKPILWRVININEDGSPMLLSDRILTFKAFDAKGDNIGRDDQRNSRNQYGSNLWVASTLRQWLNSSDMKVDYKYNLPTSENVIFNAYDDEKGFLADGNFTEAERNLILTSKIKVLIPEVDAVDGLLEGGEENHKFVTTVPYFHDYVFFRDGFNMVANYDNAYYTTVEL